MIFISDTHEEFYYENLKKCRMEDPYHQSLIYCIGISEDCAANVDRIYDFESGNLKPECIYEGWQTSGSLKVIRLAYNLYNNGVPTVYRLEEQGAKTEEQVKECSKYSVSDIFCSEYTPYFIQAICIRYPEYTKMINIENIMKDSINTRGAGRKPRFTEIDISTMQMMRFSGSTIQEIANHFNTTRQTIYKYINEKDLDVSPGVREM